MRRVEEWEKLIKYSLIGKTFEVDDLAVGLRLEEKLTAAL